MAKKMKNKKTVSIVIPTFNRTDKVCKAIDTSLAQTYKCEVIVVDHGSTDNTPKVMKKYGDKIRYIRREEDFGPHFCWLDGIMHAKGEFVHLQYDDDWIEPTFIEECMSLFRDDVGVVFTNASIIDLKIKKQVSICFHFNNGNSKTGTYPNKLLENELIFIGHKLISPSACLFRKKDIIDSLYQGDLAFKEKHIYHGVGPDLFMLLITLLRYKNFGYINKPLASFGYHENSITVDALFNEQKQQKLVNAYNLVRIYYLGLKDIQKDIKKYQARLNTVNTTISLKKILQLRFIIKPLEKVIKKF